MSSPRIARAVRQILTSRRLVASASSLQTVHFCGISSRAATATFSSSTTLSSTTKSSKVQVSSTQTLFQHSPRTASPPLARQARQAKASFHTSSSTMSAAETDAQAAHNAEVLEVTPASLSSTLAAKIGATHCAIEDMSGGCGQAFEAIIVSPQFEKKTTLARHRLVNSALKQEIAAIHAWTPKCFTPEEWERKQAS